VLKERSSSLLPSSIARPRRVLFALLAATAIIGLASAGDLEPPGPPGPTMKSLDEIPPTWSRVLPADDGDSEGCNSSRFECVANREWVLDHQTGLVWQRQVIVASPPYNWAFARTCVFFHDGGWRLPSVFELGSLRANPIVVAPDPLGLPPGHPFLIATTSSGLDFWTMTTSASDPSKAWFYRFGFANSAADLFPRETPKTELKQRWCVRDSRPGMAVY
jgi:hypothetical protein